MAKDIQKMERVEAVITPDLQKKFAYWCKVNHIPQRQAAGEAIQLFMDYKQYNFKQLQDHENSPLWVKINQVLEQLELNGQLTHELSQSVSGLQKAIMGSTGQLPESGVK